jgi:AcrR family transcriptional regulator
MATRTRTKTPPRRATPLTPGLIVVAALELADDRGEFSMRALGKVLGVDPMAIYRHFRDKEALLDAMVDALLVDFEPPPPDSGSAVERLRRMALDLRKAISTHPGIGLRASATLLTLGPHSLELTEAALDLLHEIVLDRDQAALAYLTLIRFISGTGCAEDHVRRTGQTDDEWHEEVRSAYQSVPQERLPLVLGMAGILATRSFDEQFEFGIDALLAGFVARARYSTQQGAS